jgi:hypothetical protein
MWMAPGPGEAEEARDREEPAEAPAEQQMEHKEEDPGNSTGDRGLEEDRDNGRVGRDPPCG